jgi:hypothetical protein
LQPDAELSLAQLTEFLQGAVEAIGEDLDPDADWAPTAFLISPGNEMVLISTEGWSNEREFEAYIARLCREIIERRAKAFAMVSTIWTLEMSAEELARLTVRPRDHPDKVEAVLIATYSAHANVTAQAVIERHPNSPPTLKEWLVTDSPVEGGVATPLLEALREVSDE